MFKIFKASAAAAVLGGAAVVTLALPAHATTVACANGFGDQCGTFAGHDQESPAAHDVYWDVKGTSAVANTPVIGYGADSAQDKATDFVKVLHIGVVPGLPASNGSTKSYSFVYTPNGHWSNLCVADANLASTGGHALTLRTCNGGPYQRFIAQQIETGNAPTVPWNGDRIRDNGNWPNSFALRNVAFGLFVQDTSTASSFGPAATPDTRQLKDASVSGNLASYQVWAWNGGAS